MSELDWACKRLIARLLAIDEDPATIAKEVWKATLRTLNPEQVRRLDPNRPGGGLSPDLQTCNEQTRRKAGRSEQAEPVLIEMPEASDLLHQEIPPTRDEGHRIALVDREEYQPW